MTPSSAMMMDIQSATQPLFQLLSLLNGAQEPATGQEEADSPMARLLRRGEPRGGGCSTVPGPAMSTGPSAGRRGEKKIEGALLHSGSTSPPAKTRRQKPVPFSRWQSATLLSILRHADTLSCAEKELVAIVLGLSTSQVTRWFCNARARGLRRSKKCCELETRGIGEGWGWEGGSGRSTDSSVSDEPMQHIDPRLQMAAVVGRGPGSSGGSSDGGMEAQSGGAELDEATDASPTCSSPSSAGTGSREASIRLDMDAQHDSFATHHESSTTTNPDQLQFLPPFGDPSGWIDHSLLDENYSCLLLDPFFPHSTWLASDSPNAVLCPKPSFSSPPDSFDLFSFFQ